MPYVPTGGGGSVAIGGTVTSATAGSVFFAGAAGVLAQNNAAFQWVDADTQLRLTAGAATKTPLEINLFAAQSADAFQVKDSGGSVVFGVNGTGRVLKVAGDWAILAGAGNGASGNPQWLIHDTYENGTFGGGANQRFGWNSSSTGGGGGGTDTGIGRFANGVMYLDAGFNQSKRALLGGGTSVASATALPLPTGRVFHVTGTTTITSITSTNFGTGVVITLIFDDVLTLTDGNNLKLAGDFVTTADDTITLTYDGSSWYETARSVN